MDNRRAYDAVGEQYDLEYPGPRPGELEFWLAQLPKPNARVLELACGTGRLLQPLARAGAQMTGIDSSPVMLARAKAKIAGDPMLDASAVRLEQMGMEDLELDCQFDLVMAAFNALLLVAHADFQSVLERILAHLAPNGRLISDMFAMSDYDRLPDEDRAFIPAGPDGRLHRERIYCYDPDRRLGLSEVFYSSQGRTVGPDRRHSYGLHLYGWDELQSCFAEAGFEIVGTYGGFDRRPFSDVEGQLIVVARPARSESRFVT